MCPRLDAKIAQHAPVTIGAEGRYDAAKALLARMGVVRPEVQTLLDRLTNVPEDTQPTFATADRLVVK